VIFLRVFMKSHLNFRQPSTTMSELPEIKKIEQAVRKMTDAQFSELCSELGMIESLLGEEPNERRRTLTHVQLAPDNLKHFVRTIRYVWPEAFDEPVVAPRREIKIRIEWGQIAGAIALLLIVVVAVIMFSSALNPSAEPIAEFKVTPSIIPTQAIIVAQRSPTPTPVTPSPTPAPTATPDVDATLTATYAPSPTPTGTPTRTPKPTGASTATPIAASPTVAVQAIYPRVQLRKPANNSTITIKPPVQLQWFAPGVVELNPDERYWFRLRQNNNVQFASFTSNNWFDGAPLGPGTFQWSVAIVKVDDNGNWIGTVGPESEVWNITWQ
jgi:hypothetical protein